MTTQTEAPTFRLEVYQDNRGEWRWNLYSPARDITLQSGLDGFRDREEALLDANSTLENAGLPAWTTRIDGVTSHKIDMNLPRIDPIREARDAGIKPADPEATEKAQAALAEIQKKRLAAEAEVVAEREASPEAGIVEEPKSTKHSPRAKKEEPEVNPLADQRARANQNMSE